LDATPANSTADIVGIVRKRQDELNIACLTVDEIAGLAQGHYSKITSGLKGLGLMSVFNVLEALGLQIKIEEDPDAVARLRHRWVPRQGARTNQPDNALPLFTPSGAWGLLAVGARGLKITRPRKPRQLKPIGVAYDGPTSQGIAGFNSALPVSVGGWSGITARSKKRGQKLGLRSIALARAAARNNQDRPAA
jgi:hypothetical protein